MEEKQEVKPDNEIKTKEDTKEASEEKLQTITPEPKYKEEVIKVPYKGRQMITRVRHIPIEFEGKKEEVIIKKMGFGEKAEVDFSLFDVRVRGPTPDFDITFAEMQIKSLMYGIHKAPFPVTEEYIKHELDAEIGELLYEEISEFNNLKKKPILPENSDGHTQKEPQTEQKEN